MDSGDAKSESTITNFRSQLSTVADSFLKLAPDQQSEAVKLIQGLQSVLVNHLPINVDPQDTYVLERNQQISTFLFHNLNSALGESSDSFRSDCNAFNQEEKPNIRSPKEMCIGPSLVSSHFVTDEHEFVNASRDTSNVWDEHLNITAQSYKPSKCTEKHDTLYSSTRVENLSVLQFDSHADSCLMTKDLEVSEGQIQILNQNVPISYKSMDAESINSSQTKYMPTFSVCDNGPTDTKCSNGDRREPAVFQKSCSMSTQSSHSSPKVSLTRDGEESSVHARSSESDGPVLSLHSGKSSPKQTDCVTAKIEVTGKLPEKTQASANRIKVPKANLNVEMSPKVTRGKQKKTRTRLKVNIPENFEREQKLNGTKEKFISAVSSRGRPVKQKLYFTDELYSDDEKDTVNHISTEKNALKYTKFPGVLNKHKSVKQKCCKKTVVFSEKKLMVSCRFCKQSFGSLESLKLHNCKPYSVQEGNGVLKCELCGLQFSHQQHLQKHMQGHQRNNCRICNAQFTKKKILCKHMKTAHKIVEPEKLYECPFCERRFFKRPSLLSHLKEHANGKIVCKKCGEMCENEESYSWHMEKHLEEYEFHCTQCNESFARRQQYEKHMMGHEKHGCTICGSNFSTKKDLMKHRQVVHDIHVKEEKKHLCTTCNKKFHRPTLLKIHQRVHTGEKPIKCSECDKNFRTSKALSIHMKTASHLKVAGKIDVEKVQLDKPYLCAQCGAKFCARQGLQRHMQQLHCDLRPFECPYCDYKCKCKTNLKRHIEFHTDKRRFVCEVCGAAFHAFATLKEHNAYVHSDARDYVCEQCGKGFKGRSGLKRHMRIHSDARPYLCYCGQSYKRMSHLKRHMVSSHHMQFKSKRVKKINSEDCSDGETNLSSQELSELTGISEGDMNETSYDSLTVVLTNTDGLALTQLPWGPDDYILLKVPTTQEENDASPSVSDADSKNGTSTLKQFSTVLTTPLVSLLQNQGQTAGTLTASGGDLTRPEQSTLNPTCFQSSIVEALPQHPSPPLPSNPESHFVPPSEYSLISSHSLPDTSSLVTLSAVPDDVSLNSLTGFTFNHSNPSISATKVLDHSLLPPLSQEVGKIQSFPLYEKLESGLMTHRPLADLPQRLLSVNSRQDSVTVENTTTVWTTLPDQTTTDTTTVLDVDQCKSSTVDSDLLKLCNFPPTSSSHLPQVATSLFTCTVPSIPEHQISSELSPRQDISSFASQLDTGGVEQFVSI